MPKAPSTPTRRIKADPSTGASDSGNEPYVKPDPCTPRSKAQAGGRGGEASTPTSPTKKSPTKVQAWSDAEKLSILNAFINGSSPDWNAVVEETGRPLSQVKDQWRKMMLPTLRALYGGDVKGNYVGK